MMNTSRKWTLGKTTRLILACAITACAPASFAWWESYQPEVVVADPYVEMHTGPGRGYPIHHVVGQGDSVTVLKRKTSWYRVRTARGKEGWVNRESIRDTLDLDGQPVQMDAIGFSDYGRRDWEFGVSTGDFGGAASISGYLGYSLTRNISLQVEGSQILGDFSDGYMGSANIVMHPFPQWRVSPFFTIGSGIITIKPQSTIVQAEDRTDEIVHAGLGANAYLSDRFLLRVEYKRHTVLTSRDDNEEINQWKVGFSIFM